MRERSEREREGERKSGAMGREREGGRKKAGQWGERKREREKERGIEG